VVVKYRKKPVVIEAVQWDGTRETFLTMFPDTRPEDGTFVLGRGQDRGSMYIRTLEGTHRADPGDWIIQGVQGEFYPCKPDIFEQTYDRVEDEDEDESH
jgi:hypothetical protein